VVVARQQKQTATEEDREQLHAAENSHQDSVDDGAPASNAFDPAIAEAAVADDGNEECTSLARWFHCRTVQE
jgi:hypothetical protein